MTDPQYPRPKNPAPVFDDAQFATELQRAASALRAAVHAKPSLERVEIDGDLARKLLVILDAHRSA